MTMTANPTRLTKDVDWGIPGTTTEMVDGMPFPIFPRPNGKQPGDGELEVMSSVHGHLSSMWDPNSPEEVAAMRLAFDNAKAQGRRPFHVGADGKETTPMPEFDPNAGKFIILPKIVGG